MGPHDFVYSVSAWGVRELQLKLRATAFVTWNTWYYVILSLGWFFRNFEYVDLDYDVVDAFGLVRGLGNIGFAVEN